MMKNTILRLVFVGVALSGIASSCKRKEVVETQYTRLLHTWKLVRIATDDNGNGGIDGYEIHPVQEGLVTLIAFSKDNSGNETVIAGVDTLNYPFTWSRGGGDTLIRNGVGNNIIRYNLEDITSINMRLATFGTMGKAAYYYDRQ
ncbi:MAG: hypothetical protein H7257_14355 [Taibaiella sp.]|nr:hypothetical protein [Taibaiella sp.]